jgi:hypothetical protein
MSIRAIALDLYRAQQQVAALQTVCDQASQSDRDALIQELRAAQKEMETLRKMLDGEKEAGPFRTRFTGFGGKKSK